MTTREISPELVGDLLRRPESAVLDFKWQMYHIQDKHGAGFEQNRDELIKDILALANNNATYAGEMAYLVIGAADELPMDGMRPLANVGGDFVDGETIQKYVNAACEPAIHAIEAAVVEVDHKKLVVIGVPPSQFLHETTRHLMPASAKHGFPEHTVFIRHGSNVQVASWRESDAIAKVKRLRHEERKNPPATPFGAVVGAIIGGSMLAPLGKKITDGAPGSDIAGGIVGISLGGAFGASLGHNYGNLVSIRSAWPSMSRPMRVLVVVIPATTVLIVNWLWQQANRKRNASSGKSTPESYKYPGKG